MTDLTGPDGALPSWLPERTRVYLQHTAAGQSIRALARAEGCHASTVLRRVRRTENSRDDPLVDGALDGLTRRAAASLAASAGPAADARPPATASQTTQASHRPTGDDTAMTAPLRHDTVATDEATIGREARRILRRLCETGAILAIAPDMEKAVVLRDGPDGRALRTAVVERGVAQAFALKEWIACRKSGRVAAYEITSVGRAALKRLLAEDEGRARPGFAEAQGGFDAHPPSGDPHAAQHRIWGEKVMAAGTRSADGEDATPRRMRYNLAESPLAVLARRRDANGEPFLTPDLVTAGERLREDFELAQMGPRVTQNWDRFLTAGDRGAMTGGSGTAEGPRDARDRVAAALRELGPGLGDMVLRCCCFLEGLEVAERRLGWSARSGKIVLRIALMRLKRHYEATGGLSPLIG